MIKTCLKGGILGGVIIFLWSVLSWTVLPWHAKTFHSFQNETNVAQVIQENALVSGVYVLPAMQMGANQKPAAGPMVFASVHLEGMPASMTPAMIIGLITQIVAAFLVTWLLTKTAGMSYLGRVWFVVIFGLTASILANIPDWNWGRFDTNYTLVMMAEMLIAWFLAGLFIAGVAGKQS